MQSVSRSIPDGQGTALDQIVFTLGEAGVTTTLSAGTGTLQVSCDPEDAIRANPADANLRWAEVASLSGTGPAFTAIGKVTAVRVIPSGGVCEMRVAY